MAVGFAGLFTMFANNRQTFSPRDVCMVYSGPAFSPTHDLAPYPPPPTSPVRKLSLFLSLPVCRRYSFLTEEGREMGEEPNHASTRTPVPLYILFNIQYSLLSPLDNLSPKFHLFCLGFSLGQQLACLHKHSACILSC
jgi:hypothetical protein